MRLKYSRESGVYKLKFKIKMLSPCEVFFRKRGKLFVV
jgi:hypothetical protein